MTLRATALIAEDEPLLAQSLRQELARQWPTLEVVALAGDGRTALAQALAQGPDVCFLDIRMPELGGLDLARALAEDWPDPGQPGVREFPLIVFVTAYDQYALRAFEAAAVDYLLKPVHPDRLARTCQRLQERLAARRQAAGVGDRLAQAVDLLRTLETWLPASATAGGDRLEVIQAGVGHTIHMVPLSEVLYFEAADKYVRVQTATHGHLMRMALRELLPRLDPTRFWQVHRGAIVRVDSIDRVVRDPASGRLTLHLRGRPETLTVSRLHAHRFKAM